MTYDIDLTRLTDRELEQLSETFVKDALKFLRMGMTRRCEECEAVCKAADFELASRPSLNPSFTPGWCNHYSAVWES